MEAITSEDSNSPEFKADIKQAREQIGDLFETKIFSDVTFLVKGVEFRGHKSILSTRCEYFKLLLSNLDEANANEITIEEIEPEVFNIVLEFIYKAKLSHHEEKLEAHAVDLIKAANMFGIDGLRKRSEKYLIRAKKITVKTACRYCILADEHNAPLLKEAALNFISENLEEVKKTDGYKKLKRHQSSLAGVVEILSPSKRPRLSD